MGKILIAEDDPGIAAIERDYLELNGCQVEIAAGGEAGLALRRTTALKNPFTPALAARFKAHLARYERLTGGRKQTAEIHIGGLSLHTDTRRLYVEGREVELKNKEHELLLFSAVLYGADINIMYFAFLTGYIVRAVSQNAFQYHGAILSCAMSHNPGLFPAELKG